jgi:regulator of RNase E activity RraA
LGVSVPEILQGSLSSVDVDATPTVLVVDAKGKIQKAWVGKLSSERERQVLASLH